jgi:hypothetical protein
VANLFDQEFHSDQGAALNPRLDFFISAEFLMNGGEDRTSPVLIQHRCRPGGQLRSHTLLEVEGKLGVGQQVGIPVAGSWWSSRQVSELAGNHCSFMQLV